MQSEIQELLDKLITTCSQLRDLRERVEGNESRPSAEDISAELMQVEASIVAIGVRLEQLATPVAGDRSAVPAAEPVSAVEVAGQDDAVVWNAALDPPTPTSRKRGRSRHS